MVGASAELAPWVDEARTRPGFRTFWDDGGASTQAFVAACFTLADLGTRSTAERHVIYDRAATARRQETLATVAADPAVIESLKTLERCEAASFTAADWRALFDLLVDVRTRRALAKTSRVTPTLVRQLAAVPAGLRLARLLEVLASLAVDADHWRQLTAALEQLGPQRRTTLLRTARNVRDAAGFWDLVYRCLDGVLTERTARRGPIALDRQFTPLTTPLELQREGRLMDNCLGRLASRAARGESLYFAWTQEPRATVELTVVDDELVLGDIGCVANGPVPELTVAGIRAAVARSLGPAAIANHREAASRVRGEGFERCMALARVEFPERDRGELADALWSIHGRSLGPKNGAYVILQASASENLYFQCLADLGSTYFVEICSHWYSPVVSSYLTSPVVRLLAESGFEWPRQLANFRRVFRVESRADCVDLADFALGALRTMFGLATSERLAHKVHLPVGHVAAVANDQPEQGRYWARREAAGSVRADQETTGVLKPIAQSEAAGVFWSAYSKGRRFRVVRDGASLVHGSFGEHGGKVPLAVGSVITLGGWRSDMDGYLDLIWEALDGQPIIGISGNDPHREPWAMFSPSCRISYMPRSRKGAGGLPNPEQVSAPDPSFLQPIDEAGMPQPW